jgi:hypothetical protein
MNSRMACSILLVLSSLCTVVAAPKPEEHTDDQPPYDTLLFTSISPLMDELAKSIEELRLSIEKGDPEAVTLNRVDVEVRARALRLRLQTWEKLIEDANISTTRNLPPP